MRPGLRPARRPGRGLGGSSGHSLLELVTSLAVVAVVFLVATGVLREGQILIVHFGRAALNPVPELTLALLRHDVYAARGYVGGHYDWSSAPLVLDRTDGRRVHYRRHEGGLERVEFDPHGEVLSTRRLLTDLVDWRWRLVSPRLLELDIVYGESAGSVNVALSGPVTRGTPFVETRLRLALRGGVGGQRW